MKTREDIMKEAIHECFKEMYAKSQPSADYDELLEKFTKIETVDERLTTVAAHKTMNFLDVNKTKKRGIVDTISAVYILEMYMNKNK